MTKSKISLPIKNVEGEYLCDRCSGTGLCPSCSGTGAHSLMSYDKYYCDRGKCKPCGGTGWTP